MRSEIRATDGHAVLTVIDGKIVLRVETTYREEAQITLDPHVAALLAGEVERAAWKAQRRPERRKCPECPGGDLCYGPACLVQERPASAPAEHLGGDL